MFYDLLYQLFCSYDRTNTLIGYFTEWQHKCVMFVQNNKNVESTNRTDSDFTLPVPHLNVCVFVKWFRLYKNSHHFCLISVSHAG